MRYDDVGVVFESETLKNKVLGFQERSLVE
jgi:hypothetical protein